MYCAQSDIEARFGIKTTAQASNLEGGADADTSRITAAIADAQSKIDDFFRQGSPYAVPLQVNAGSIATLTGWAAVIAFCWLYESRGMTDENSDGNKYSKMKEQVYGDMALYRGGMKKLDAVLKYPTRPTGAVIQTNETPLDPAFIRPITV